MLGAYNKAITALIMAVVGLVQQIWGINLGLDESTVTIILGAITTILVYVVPNKPASSSASTFRSPPVATGVAFAAALAVILFLAGCTSFSVGRDATLQQRVDAARVDLATASLFVDLYASFPVCGDGVPQPCSNANVVSLLVKGRVAAAAALDAVDALIAAGSPTERILVALAEAQKAIVLLQNLRGNAAAG